MKKLIPLLLILLAVALVGCLPQATAVPTSTVTATVMTLPTSTPKLSIPTATLLLPDAGCTVVAQKPTPGPTPESIYPPITDADHTKGPADARVTIVEYSDFQ